MLAMHGEWGDHSLNPAPIIHLHPFCDQTHLSIPANTGSSWLSCRIRRILSQSRIMSIAQNKKAFHDYFIEEQYEAGVVLEGWEVKAIREGKVQLKEAYVIIQRGEIYIIGCHITPLGAASTHVRPDATRTRKLLLHNEQIAKLIGQVERAGYTLVPLDMHYTRGRIKIQIGLAKGKKQYDKRESEKERDWVREKARIMRQANK